MNKLLKKVIQSNAEKIVKNWENFESQFFGGRVKSQGIELNSEEITKITNSALNGHFCNIEKILLKDLDVKLNWRKLIPRSIEFSIDKIEIEVEWLETDTLFDFNKIIEKEKPPIVERGAKEKKRGKMFFLN